MIAENKTGRNAPCSCGSNKKYKYCCGVENTPKKKVLAPLGLIQCLIHIVKTKHEGEVTVSCEELEALVTDKIVTNMKIHYDPATESFQLQVVEMERPKQGKILTPDRKIIV